MADPRIRKFIEDAVIYPPMDIFEEVDMTSEQMAETVLSKSEKLFGKKGNPAEFFEWSSKLVGAAHEKLAFAFYGKMAYGNGSGDGVPSDVDILVFVSEGSEELGNLIDYRNRPVLVHPQFLYHAGKSVDGISGWKRSCVANTMLLYPSNHDNFVHEIIEKGRKLIEKSPFFHGGVGDIITYAAYKVMDGKEEKYFESDDEKQVLSKRLVVWEQYMDGMPAPPQEVYRNIRNELRNNLDDGELTSLTKAAMRRIKIRKEKQEKIADKFIRRLRLR